MQNECPRVTVSDKERSSGADAGTQRPTSNSGVELRRVSFGSELATSADFSYIFS
jgi:hypothetical protein